MSLLKLLFSLISLTTLGVSSDVAPPSIETPPTIEVKREESPSSTIKPLEAEPVMAASLRTTEIAQCLTDKGVKFYGAFWCPHCHDQKELFGDAMQYIDYIECDARGENSDPEACLSANITSYPTWIFPGQERLVGARNVEELAEKASCL